MVDSSAPATAYIVQLLFEAIHGEVTKTAADVLFFGIATDTGFFRFLEEDSADVFEAISRLIKKGASPKKTYNIMTGGKSFLSRKLLGRHLDNAKTYFDGKLIITYETPEDTQNFGQNGRDSDALYQILLAIEGVEAIVNIKQETPEQCTAGFRSIENIDVSVIAAHFGGGGHKNASGASYTSTIDEVIPLILHEFHKIWLFSSSLNNHYFQFLRKRQNLVVFFFMFQYFHLKSIKCVISVQNPNIISFII